MDNKNILKRNTIQSSFKANFLVNAVAFMSKNHKTWKQLLPCLALAVILVFGTAMRFPADAISPNPATVQASTGDYFNLAYEKTVEFVQPLWEKIKLFADQPKDWKEISQNLVNYAKEKPLMAALVGAGTIWVPFGLFRAFRSKNDEEDSEYEEFMSSEFEDEEEEEDGEGEFEDEDDEEEYQKNLREFNEEEEEEDSTYETAEQSEIIEDESVDDVIEETALLEEDESEEVFEDFESETLDNADDDFGFLEEDEEESLLFQDDEEDEFADLREDEELEENDEFSDIFSESPSNSEELTDSVPVKDFSTDADTSDDVLKKLESEFASLESEFSEVDDFIDQENKKNETIGAQSGIKSGSEKIISSDEDEEAYSEVDQLLSASESLSNLDASTSPEDLASDPFENGELSSNIMDIINKEAVTADTVSKDDSSTSSPQKMDIEGLEDEEELDQTLKDLQAEMEQTIQEISSQIDLDPEYETEAESEDHAVVFETPETEENVSDDLVVQSASILTDEDEEPTIDEILKQAEEEAEKELKDLLPESSVFLEEEANESAIEEEILETQTIPDTVEETFKDVFAEALETDTFQDLESDDHAEDPVITTAEVGSEAENVEEIIGLVEEETSQETNLPQSIIAEEKQTEFPDLTEESPDSFDPLLPALDAATYEEVSQKPRDKQIDPVKANSYIKSLGAFQRNLENRLNTLKYFPPIEETKPPTPKADEFEIGEPVVAEEPDIDFDHIGESPEKKYSLELMESFILLDNQK